MTERGDFATLLRAWRDRLHPAAAGLPAGAGRRAAGLRREELAALAGVSVDYVVRLEQGRADRPSAQVVAAIARALQVSEGERDQLYVAAGLAAPLPTVVPTFVPPSVQRLITRMPDAAIAVCSADWTILTTNAAWDALHGAPPASGPERNVVRRHFLGSPTRLLREEGETERFEQAITSDLRTTTVRYPQDRQLQALIDELVAGSPRFAELWAQVGAARHRTERKTILHPTVGPVLLDCDVLSVSGEDLHIVTNTAEPGTEDASRFDLIRALGATGAAPLDPADSPLLPS
ncbi:MULTISPECIES: helix-turn-helix transcriptional regulator [unclassified Curtobacterium]|uniref:helix-turn-helix transcriptional regulator n=1 Tax=unclassified Curtobacterium TaxID=257496 RepID=UPI000DA860F3|nr:MULTISPECIES: helix-turn-helix transcriptional regulator [unclassified Curtobacterium]PZE78352.1 transcriptional regulator [Curtobacterium sp. MCBD17_019]WIE55191.1 helix-turn-helix transcriptional regulator [Curtobacterium sp. MCBD17_003]